MDKEKIITFCKQMHKNQRRRGGEPYIDHVFETAEISLKIAENLENNYIFLKDEKDELFYTGLLHDTIEDTNTDYEDILELTNEKITSWVVVLTNDKRLPTEFRRYIYYETIKNSCVEIKIIKLADIYSNLIGLVGNEGNQWILQFIQKAKTTLDSLNPELTNTEYYKKCLEIIKSFEKY